jgi:type I restriction enzyme R subunit
MSHFSHLRARWPQVHAAALKAEQEALSDPRTACFYARRAMELAVKWLYLHEPALKLPYQDHLAALIHESTFRERVGPALHAKVKVIKDLGNRAVHGHDEMGERDGINAVRELFHLGYWLARTYAATADERPPMGLGFNPAQLARPAPVAFREALWLSIEAPTERPRDAAFRLETLEAELAQRDAKLTDLLTGKAALDDELQRLRAEVAAARARNEAAPDTHDYSESETRDAFIDLLLKEAGWPLAEARDREYPVTGMPNAEGKGLVDYVLWGDDGKPLAVVEAKRTRRDARVGQQQARLYADCLERQFGQRPLIFCTNGYEHWLWDDAFYPPRAVAGFLKKDELQLAIQRRTARQPLAAAPINAGIVERAYQSRAIRRVAEAFEVKRDRRALLVMATGAGKTRTVIALADLLMRCHWVKRVLFLADRVALVNQAVNAFKAHLPSAAPVNLVTERDAEGRVFVSTYPTMMNLIDETQGGARRFGPGHFDLVVIDEAHRSVYQRYGAIFDYFDSLLVGLTATPRAEIDRNTYRLFNLEAGVPTDYYDLEQAVADGYLVPPRAVSVPLKFARQGIRYDELTEDERDQWDALEWTEDGEVPDRVDAEALNRWLFNEDTVDKVLAHLMTNGEKVAGGDRLGKTIVFAKSEEHAQFIARRFDANWPHYKGEFARVITFKTEYAQTLIDAFSAAHKPPHIAISVDMLDTGIDVPEIVNLVFFKLVRSKTKFWQMVGRGTRLRPDLFGPGRHKTQFFIFDFCGNLEYFSQDPPVVDGALADSLSTRLFRARVDLVGELDAALKHQAQEAAPNNESGLRLSLISRLRDEVRGMSLDNFIVRPHRRWVEKFQGDGPWHELGRDDRNELAEHLAGLPTALVDDDEEAKRFDLLLLTTQLALLRQQPALANLSKRVREIAALMAEQATIPMVAAQLPLIERVLSDAFWQGVTVVELEEVRRKLRALVRLIEKSRRKPVYSDFEDEIGAPLAVALPGVTGGSDPEKFRAKVRAFLRAHADHLALARLRRAEPLTATDLAELERMLVEAGAGSAQEVVQMAQAHGGLGRFVRSLVGLERDAAKQAFAGFMRESTLTADQIEFIDLVIDHLTERGAMEPRRLYETPFVDRHPLGVSGLFDDAQVGRIVTILRDIDRRAA